MYHYYIVFCSPSLKQSTWAIVTFSVYSASHLYIHTYIQVAHISDKIKGHIELCIQESNEGIREHAIRCLGLFCLLDEVCVCMPVRCMYVCRYSYMCNPMKASGSTLSVVRSSSVRLMKCVCVCARACTSVAIYMYVCV
jgi:hypothetical protein